MDARVTALKATIQFSDGIISKIASFRYAAYLSFCGYNYTMQIAWFIEALQKRISFLCGDNRDIARSLLAKPVPAGQVDNLHTDLFHVAAQHNRHLTGCSRLSHQGGTHEAFIPRRRSRCNRLLPHD